MQKTNNKGIEKICEVCGKEYQAKTVRYKKCFDCTKLTGSLTIQKSIYKIYEKNNKN